MEDRLKHIFQNYFKKTNDYLEFKEIKELTDNLEAFWSRTNSLNIDKDAVYDLENLVEYAVEAAEMQGFILGWKFFSQLAGGKTIII